MTQPLTLGPLLMLLLTLQFTVMTVLNGLSLRVSNLPLMSSICHKKMVQPRKSHATNMQLLWKPQAVIERVVPSAELEYATRKWCLIEPILLMMAESNSVLFPEEEEVLVLPKPDKLFLLDDGWKINKWATAKCKTLVIAKVMSSPPPRFLLTPVCDQLGCGELFATLDDWNWSFR